MSQQTLGPRKVAPKALRRWLTQAAGLFARNSALLAALAYLLLAPELAAPRWAMWLVDNLAWQTLFIAALAADHSGNFDGALKGTLRALPSIALAVLAYNTPGALLDINSTYKPSPDAGAWSQQPAFVPGLTELFLHPATANNRWSMEILMFWQFTQSLTLIGAPWGLAPIHALRGTLDNWMPLLGLAAIAWCVALAVSFLGATYLAPILTAYLGCVHWVVIRDIYLGQSANKVHATGRTTQAHPVALTTP